MIANSFFDHISKRIPCHFIPECNIVTKPSCFQHQEIKSRERREGASVQGANVSDIDEGYLEARGLCRWSIERHASLINTTPFFTPMTFP
jgi:hypothetical protein